MAFFIALKDLRIVMRDKKALMLLILMPAVIIFILGSALGGVMNEDYSVKKFSIAVVNKDDGIMSQIFINEILRNEMSKMFNTFVVDKNKGEEMLKDKKIPSVIIIPENFSNDVDSGKQVSLTVKSGLENKIKTNIVKAVAGGFAQNLSLNYGAAYSILGVVDKNKVPINISSQSGVSKATALMSEIQKKIGSQMIKFTSSDQEKQKTTTAMQYYSSAMLVMFLLFGANMGTKTIVEERENKTLGRVMSTRVNRFSLITGKTIGLIFICLAQALVLIVFTGLIYGADWGNIPGVIIVTLCSVFAASGFGVLVAAVSKTSKMADGLGMLFIQLSTMLSGGMVPLPASMKTLSMCTLNWWAHQSYIDLMVGSGVLAVLPYCGVLVAIGVVLLGIGVAMFKV
jgi:ABC-2 type transport system permease protein